MSSLLINEHPLMVLPGLATKIGLNEAIILQQIHYWTRDKRHIVDGRSWTYNSIPEWRKQFPFWSEVTIRRTLKSLEDKGLIVRRALSDNRFDATHWYALDMSKLADMDDRADPINLIAPSDQVDRVRSDQIDHITRTETTKTSSKTSKPRAVKTSIPDDFGISAMVDAWAKNNGHTNLQGHLESFRLKCKAKGYQYVDWDSAFMEAIRKDWAVLNAKPSSGRAYGKQAEWDAAIAGFAGSSGNPDDPYTIDMEYVS